MHNRPTNKNGGESAAPDLSALSRFRRAYRGLLRKREQEQRALWHFQYFELQMIRSQDLQSLLQLLLREAPGYFKLGGTKLQLYDPDGTVCEIFTESLGTLPDNLVFTGEGHELQALFPAGIKVRMLEPGEELISGETVAQTSTGAVVLLPLVRQGTLVGCLQLAGTAESGFQSPDAEDRLVHFSALVAICIENCSNRERLRLHSLIDALTGVRNRRGFEESLDKEVARAKRTGLPLTAMFVDLDHFKRVNDKYGHPCGDRVLVEIVRNIGEVLRPTDMLSRYGGEEFVALLPACDDGQAKSIARRINLSVAALDLFDDTGELFHLSCSVGYSSWLDPALPGVDAPTVAQHLIGQADKAVYRAKQAGRDRARYLPL